MTTQPHNPHDTDENQDSTTHSTTTPIVPGEATFTGSATLDLSHPDDMYLVHDDNDADAPARPRPAADPHVVFTYEGTHAPFAVMQDLGSTEAFILADPSAWIGLDEMA